MITLPAPGRLPFVVVLSQEHLSGVARGGAQGARAPPFALVGVCREWQGSAGSDCVALLPADKIVGTAVLCVCECGRQKQPHPLMYAHAHKQQAQQRKNF